jgi:hypothetical protein
MAMRHFKSTLNNLALGFTGIKPQSRREHRGRTDGERPSNRVNP